MSLLANRTTHLLYVACTIAACALHANRRPDLTGSITCGTLTCSDGQLCQETERDGSMGSANPIDDFYCIAAPPICDLRECSYSCAERPGGSCCPGCIAHL